MKVTTEEANLFFELMWLLQYYVNNKLNIIKNIKTLEEYKELPQEKKFKVREAVYKNPNLLDDYISNNPNNLITDQLSIIKEWKGFKIGDYYIERYLKNYAVFIGNKNVYGVLGLHSSIDEIFPKFYLPLYVKTVLLPFKGKIVYDGLMQSYNILFGGGIKRNLKETYLRAKQKGKIIFSLGKPISKQGHGKEKAVSQQKDWSKEIEQLISISKKLKGGTDQFILNSPVFSLVKVSIDLANQAVIQSSDVDTLIKELKKVEKAVNKIKNILYRFD